MSRCVVSFQNVLALCEVSGVFWQSGIVSGRFQGVFVAAKLVGQV